jgi:ankyrin repeat protein
MLIPMTSRLSFVVIVVLGFWPLGRPAAVEVSANRKLFMANQPPEYFFDGPALELARAIDRSDAEAIRRLSPQVEINRVHRQGMTLLFYALTTKKHSAVTELIKAGANPKQVDKELGSPMDLAVQAKESKSLESILDAGVSPNATNSWGTPLLFTAACLDSEENLKLLVARKADLDATDKNLGRTAVFEAVSKRCYDQAAYLIEHGAKVDVTTVNGVTLAYSVQWDLEHHKSGTPGFEILTKLKRLMHDRGIKFPADPPPVVRAQMKAKGLKVAE